jgi:predicted transcriptional regulator
VLIARIPPKVDRAMRLPVDEREYSGRGIGGSYYVIDIPDDLAIGPTVRKMRLHRRLSQEDLAVKAGLSVRALRDIEVGRTEYPHRATVRRIAAALCLDEDASSTLVGRSPRRLQQLD